jgi:predicted proteasome-type protease
VSLRRVDADDPYFRELRESYAEALREALAALPLPDWIAD